MVQHFNTLILFVALSGLLAGCGSRDGESKPAGKSHASAADNSPAAKTLFDGSGDGTRRRPAFGGLGDKRPSPAAGRNAAATPAAIAETLKPLQVLVGRWKGLTRKRASGTETPQWRWDFSNPRQPALAFDSKASTYFRTGRLTYLPPEGKFQLAAAGKDGITKTYLGTLTEPVEDASDDGKTVQRSFTLTLTQVDPAPRSRERYYRIAFQQLRNDRYLTILSNKAGERVTEWDRIANQRQGTSFATKLDDYGDKTCVVSQGLGTMTVSHKGRTYYVCCSGCKKAFEAEPQKWVDAFAEWRKKNGKK
ncbi:MAG: hypothetical protein ACE5KM_15585 [Planctomycetaceae bacterium]